MRTVAAISGAVLLGAASSAARAQTPGFWLTGYAPGTMGSGVSGLSADGLVACGGSSGVGFTWTREGGRYDFGLEPGMPGVTVAYGISSDATVLAGQVYPNSGVPLQSRAYRRAGSGPLVDLGVLPGTTRSYARGISGDGSVVVGACEFSQSTGLFGQAFRWTAQGGMQGLGYTRPGGTMSRAHAISRDGSTIVGYSQSDGFGGPVEGFVWREGAGIQALPNVPGWTGWTQASAVSADGSVIVGQADAPTGGVHAVRWTAAGIQDLGVVPGYTNSLALSVSGDGTVIGGRLSSDTAFVWTTSTGILQLSDYLASSGISVPPNLKLASVLAISDDGRTFAGYTINLQTSVQEGFVATVPAPASVLSLILLAPCLRRRRRGAA